MKTPTISSNFALLDVMRGRKALATQIKKGRTFRVQIDMEIEAVHGNDDGVSIEFSGTVEKVTYL